MLEQSVSQYCDQNNFKNQKIAVACSGGVDSMVLLECLSKIYPSQSLLCLHFDHKVRSDSNLAVELIREFCFEKKIFFVSQENLSNNKTDENSLRELRYEFLLSACEKHGFKILVLGHNLNDQVETIVFRLFRGTNIKGLQGIPQVRFQSGIELHRPLLACTKQQIIDYAKTCNLKFIEDSTNLNTDYHRNFIRHEILPLAAKINSSYLSNVNRLSQIVAQQEAYIDSVVDLELEKLGALPWKLNQFSCLDIYVQRRILERVFTTQIDFVNQFLESIKEGGFHRINFEQAKFFTIKQKQIFLEQ